jgi:hypothetical protein
MKNAPVTEVIKMYIAIQINVEGCDSRAIRDGGASSTAVPEALIERIYYGFVTLTSCGFGFQFCNGDFTGGSLRPLAEAILKSAVV